MMLTLPIRSYSDIGRLVHQWVNDGGDIAPLIEQIEAGTASKRWARRQIEGMLRSHPEFACRHYRPFIGREVAQVARLAIADPTFPERLEAGLSRSAHFTRAFRTRLTKPLDLLRIASITHGE